MAWFSYKFTLGDIEYDVNYGHDKVVGYFLDIFDDPHLDPIISHTQFISTDPFENFEGLFRQEILMKSSGFNGKTLALLLMLFKLPSKYWFHIGQLKQNPEPPIRSNWCLTEFREIKPAPYQLPDETVGLSYVRMENESGKDNGS